MAAYSVVWLPALGKKGPLASAFQETLKGGLVATDSSESTAHASFLDHWEQSPLTTSASFLEWAQGLCRRLGVSWIIPTRDAEISLWAQWAEAGVFGDTQVLVSSAAMVEIWSSKLRSTRWLEEAGLPHPGWYNSAEEAAQFLGSMVAKPDSGAASQGVRFAHTPQERADLLSGLKPSEGLQPFVEGPEYTLNLYFDPNGTCQAVIPHQRMETRDGEVSRGITVDDADLLALGKSFAIQTQGNVRGPLNFQAIRSSATGKLFITDINPRFGGGYPLTHKAGGRFVDWICREFIQGKPVIDYSWSAGVQFKR